MSVKPEDFPWISTHLVVADVPEAIEFYKNAFGFTPGITVPNEDGAIEYADMRYHDSAILIGKEGKYGSLAKTPKNSGSISPMAMYVYVDNVDDFYKRAITEGAHSLEEPQDTFWGDRLCRLLDPNGYAWAFATKVKN